MAGGALKTIGVLALLLGVLLLLGGLGAAGYGYYDQEQHAEDAGPLGVAEDSDRTQQNEMLLAGGAVAAGVGLILLITGVILMASGRTRATHAMNRELVAAASGSGAGATADAADATPPAAAVATGDDPTRVRRLTILAIVGVLLFATTVVFAVVGPGSIGGLQGSSQAQRSDGLTVIGAETYDRTIPATATVLGSSRTPESTSHAFTAKPGTDVLEANVTWEPAETGSASIQFSLEIDIDGAWVEVASKTGSSPIVLRVDDADKEWDLSGASMRFRAFPGKDGLNEAQDYTVALTFFQR